MKKVLVTGASGRIGRRVVPLLLERGYKVSATVRRTQHAESWAKEVEPVQLSFPAPEPLQTTIQGFDALVHLAGIMPPASDDEVFGTNIEGTYQLLQAIAALENKPRLSTRCVTPSAWRPTLPRRTTTWQQYLTRPGISSRHSSFPRRPSASNRTMPRPITTMGVRSPARECSNQPSTSYRLRSPSIRSSPKRLLPLGWFWFNRANWTPPSNSTAARFK